MELWELTAREQVRDTLAEYNHAGDRGRVAELAACFTVDGVLEVKGRPLARGRAAVLAALGGSAGAGSAVPHRFVRHHVSTVRLESVDPERVQAAAYFLVLTAFGPDHWGRYRDVLVPAEGRWLLAHRRVTVDAAVASTYLDPDLIPGSPGR